MRSQTGPPQIIHHPQPVVEILDPAMHQLLKLAHPMTTNELWVTLLLSKHSLKLKIIHIQMNSVSLLDENKINGEENKNQATTFFDKFIIYKSLSNLRCSRTLPWAKKQNTFKVRNSNTEKSKKKKQKKTNNNRN